MFNCSKALYSNLVARFLVGMHFLEEGMKMTNESRSGRKGEKNRY